MSLENLEPFKRLTEAGSRRDWDAVMDELAPDVRWVAKRTTAFHSTRWWRLAEPITRRASHTVYVVPKGGSRRNGKLTELTEVDLAEISAVRVPANQGARTLSIKATRPVQLVSFEVA